MLTFFIKIGSRIWAVERVQNKHKTTFLDLRDLKMDVSS